MSIMSNAKRALRHRGRRGDPALDGRLRFQQRRQRQVRFQRRRVFRQDRGRRLHQPVGFRGRRPRRQQRRSHQHHDQDQRRGARLRATSQDVAKFGTAKVAVVNGADYDPWATKAAQPTKATLVTAAETAGIKEGDNPHVWFSAKVRSNTADAITAATRRPTRATRTTTPSSTKNGTPRKTSLSPRSRRLPPRPRACRTPPPNPWPGTWPTTSR